MRHSFVVYLPLHERILLGKMDDGQPCSSYCGLHFIYYGFTVFTTFSFAAFCHCNVLLHDERIKVSRLCLCVTILGLGSLDTNRPKGHHTFDVF